MGAWRRRRERFGWIKERTLQCRMKDQKDGELKDGKKKKELKCGCVREKYDRLKNSKGRSLRIERWRSIGRRRTGNGNKMKEWKKNKDEGYRLERERKEEKRGWDDERKI